MSTQDRPVQDVIFNGTGINYSWHLPKLFELSVEQWSKFHSLTFISGASPAFLVYWSVKHGLCTWSREDFLNWNRHSARVYGNGLLNGMYRFAKIALKSRTPVYRLEQYRKAWEIGVRPGFFELQMRELPANVRIPMLKHSTGEIVVASAQSEFAKVPVSQVSFAATAIPGIFPNVMIHGESYGDIMYSKKFLPWLRAFEAQSAGFEDYNLMKQAELPNGRYIKLGDHPDPKKMLRQDNMKFLFGRHIESFPANIRKTNLG